MTGSRRSTHQKKPGADLEQRSTSCTWRLRMQKTMTWSSGLDHGVVVRE